MCLASAYIDDNEACQLDAFHRISCRHTCIFLVFRIRRLKEDLDAVKRGDDRLRLENVSSKRD